MSETSENNTDPTAGARAAAHDAEVAEKGQTEPRCEAGSGHEEAEVPGPNGDSGRSDNLLDCLILVVRSHGGALTRDTALAGLPIGRLGLTPSLFPRAAKRAGFASSIVQRALSHLNEALFPAILLLHGNQACVLLGRTQNSDYFRVIFPDLGDSEVTISEPELASRYSGRAIYLRPQHRFDARSPEVHRTRRGHWFWNVIAENRKLYRDVLIASFLINVFAVAMPLFVMNVYDRVVPNHAFETLWVLAIGVLLVLAADFAMRTMRGYFVDLASSRADVKLSAHIMEKVLGLRMEDRPPSAGAFAANLRAFESVRDFIGSATVLAFIDVPFAFLFLAVIAWLGWPLVVPFVIGAGLLLTYAFLVQRRMHDLAETIYRASAQRNATLVEALVGIETIKAIGSEGPVQRRWENSAALLARVGAQLRLLSSSASNMAVWVQHSVGVAVVIIGVYLIADGQLSMGGLIAAYLLSSRTMAPLGQVAGLLVQYHNAATSLASLDQLMAQQEERPVDANFISRPALRGAIEFRNVSFAYPGEGGPVLKGVSLRIRPGERVAVLGRVGSGKSTFAKLILQLYRPTSGSILVDGIDLRQIDPAELRRNIGYVAQGATLFYGSLRENIALAAPHVDDEILLRAARIAGILDFANAHPQGFDMQVHERGESLSGGQRQAVAVARAVINDPPILVLDEPTSSMDHTTESDLKRRLLAFSQGKTVIVVTHRTTLLDLVDRVIVFDGGRVVADGPKAHVIEALKQGRVGRVDA